MSCLLSSLLAQEQQQSRSLARELQEPTIIWAQLIAATLSLFFPARSSAPSTQPAGHSMGLVEETEPDVEFDESDGEESVGEEDAWRAHGVTGLVGNSWDDEWCSALQRYLQQTRQPAAGMPRGSGRGDSDPVSGAACECIASMCRAWRSEATRQWMQSARMCEQHGGSTCRHKVEKGQGQSARWRGGLWKELAKAQQVCREAVLLNDTILASAATAAYSGLELRLILPHRRLVLEFTVREKGRV
jgi:hypothetical protein